ncbi:MAG: hypothetical protein DRP50_00405 [Thermotoga sp.]|nr:hypothetical protein [Thermotogota bacterium]RKX56398.1 MAG: hypothetical protein DRP50_00405 [Thermotoga sp.]
MTNINLAGVIGAIALMIASAIAGIGKTLPENRKRLKAILRTTGLVIMGGVAIGIFLVFILSR